jgi:hypothetical protein
MCIKLSVRIEWTIVLRSSGVIHLLTIYLNKYELCTQAANARIFAQEMSLA